MKNSGMLVLVAFCVLTFLVAFVLFPTIFLNEPLKCKIYILY